MRPYAEYLVAAYGLTITSVKRSRTEQLRLWNNRHNSKYPVAPPGTSAHERGLAFDAVAPADRLEAAGRAWEAMGGEWGGRYRDAIHFQARRG